MAYHDPANLSIFHIQFECDHYLVIIPIDKGHALHLEIFE